MTSGVGTNLKVGRGARGGAPIRRKTPELFFGRAPPLFLALRVQLVVLASAFMMVSTAGQFLVCCSSTHGAPMPSHL